ncbi:hypothetical protein PAAG_07536 [Paracoccidioides lutzii Pb01]|uniref:Uncharacterized protein n=1 Tax=Paracoccidioides lutzii (strain ATCC MYA-826 / Pb01) TaxID=502779 RepID=C1H9U5_PARBA|nr:hypothetical protein PAAG_07536 [Paracoccidioides lutzii Pb01]EEH37118.2 hypothetical protein PAAG_07536 [Paracoccidioides lutzii Pb01]
MSASLGAVRATEEKALKGVVRDGHLRFVRSTHDAMRGGGKAPAWPSFSLSEPLSHARLCTAWLGNGGRINGPMTLGLNDKSILGSHLTRRTDYLFQPPLVQFPLPSFIESSVSFQAHRLTTLASRLLAYRPDGGTWHPALGNRVRQGPKSATCEWRRAKGANGGGVPLARDELRAVACDENLYTDAHPWFEDLSVSVPEFFMTHKAPREQRVSEHAKE